LVVILGSTAVGKTEIAIELAQGLGGEIVSADSRLFYRGMDIGTAKPTDDERARVPHHLIDVADPDETWSLSVFQRAAREAITEIDARGRLPFLVGGTGQYIRAATDGWSPPSVKPNDALRAALESLAGAKSASWLHARLATVDAAAAARIDPRNLRRTIRAWEVILLTGLRFSQQTRKGDPAYRICQVGLTRPRAELYARVDARIDIMFHAGLLEEVRGLLENGFSPDLPSMSGIGYRECVAVLRGDMSVDQAKASMRRLTRSFIRRQANWFKDSDPEIRWFRAGEEVVGSIAAYIRAVLGIHD
jgi:tRNA dimethylallyltransferase